MSLVLSLKNLLPGKPENEWLMEQYRLTQKARYLELLYKSCSDDLYHYLLNQSDKSLAQDICQRTWLTVMEKRNHYRNSGRFTGWLYAIARNLLIDELRRQKKFVAENEATAEIEKQPTSQASITQQRITEAAYDQLSDALMKLPFYQREALVLQQDGFGLQEIAQITRTDTETIKSRIRYAKSKLKKMWRAAND